MTVAELISKLIKELDEVSCDTKVCISGEEFFEPDTVYKEEFEDNDGNVYSAIVIS